MSSSVGFDSSQALAQYMRDIRKYPLLQPEEEQQLARIWRESNDAPAAHKLLTSHLRLVARIALGYRGYGMPISDLISEGNIGMMRAIERYDPDRGFRLATYALWWIRAAIQDYILHSWSLVKIGTTPAQRKLFFNLRRLKAQARAPDEGDLSPEHVDWIARVLDVSQKEVVNMSRRLSGPDHSLNAPLGEEGGDEWQDWLEDESGTPEDAVADHEEMSGRKALLPNALQALNPRQRDILTERRLKDTPATLDELAQKYGVSRERIRQIETGALHKLQQIMRSQVAERRHNMVANSPALHAAIARA
jgi:RNA polymerase sigma-32 factor